MIALHYSVFDGTNTKKAICLMSHQERASVVAIAICLLLNGYISVRLWDLFETGALSGENAPMVWARAIVWVVPAAIALTVLSNIGFAIVTRGRKQKINTDERDHLYRSRGMCITLFVFAFGFVGMLIGLATGWSVVIALTLLYAAAALGDLAGQCVRLASYRIGC
tara:strand:+ start:413 stop:910 length:498 start_codon:yes stop_codon:yes gene_type:complete